MTEFSSFALKAKIFLEALPNEKLAKGKLLFLNVHWSSEELGKVIFARYVAWIDCEILLE